MSHSNARETQKNRVSEIKQRGFYSDILGADAKHLLKDVSKGPNVLQGAIHDVATERHTPYATTFSSSNSEDKTSVGESPPSVSVISDFPPDSFQPKVQLPFFTRPGQCPRRIEIERRKRIYSKFDLDEQLAYLGVDTSLLMPSARALDDVEPVRLNGDSGDAAPFLSYLALETFDDADYEIREPNEWLAMGWVAAENARYPIPGRALLPTRDDLGQLNARDPSIEYKWFYVGVLDYDDAKAHYLVQKVNKNGRVVDTSGRTVVNGGRLNDGSHLSIPGQYWVPRLRVMFSAEDPRYFAERVRCAYSRRRETEALLRYNLYIDCMPMEGVGELDRASLKRMTDCAKAAPQLAKERELDDYVQMLEKEVNIDFCWSMNRIILDKIVKEEPDTFAFVTVPEPVVEKIPLKGCFDVVNANEVIEEGYEVFKYDAFAKLSLLTRVEVIQAIVKVKTECNRVAAMSLYHPTTKHMRLEEFEQTQGQACAQVGLFLKDSWISTLRVSIKTSLRDIGRGWFNLHETNVEVYQVSKLKKFMEMVKFNMQDSLRYLVQDSLMTFSQLFLDACYSTRQCSNDMVWPGDILSSPFKPRRNPLFLVDLILDNQGVRYSMVLAHFENAAGVLFDKGLQACQNVPQLEKYILEDIFFSGTPLLEAVGMGEPFVVELRDVIRNAMARSIIPMKAYARQYLEYLEIINIDINNYVRDLELKKPSAVEIKAEVEMHLKNKDIVEVLLPTSIVIGPFYIYTDGVRQGLSKKRKALAGAALDLLAKKLRTQAEEACEEFRSINRRLFDKPNSIEELTELKEWTKTIPDKIASQQSAIDAAMADYDLIEGFNYNLTSEDFNIKWTTAAWPHKLMQLIDQVALQWEEDEERFQKLQLADLTAFNDRLDNLTMQVAGMPAFNDISKAHEIANLARRLQKDLKDALNDATKFNNRERLFDMPITNYDKVGKLVKDFEPYRALWITSSDWLRGRESWMNDALAEVDAEKVEKTVTEAYKTIHKSLKFFQDVQGVLEMAEEVKQQIEDFKPYIPLIQGLRNPGMRQRHWDLLSKELGFSLSLKSNVTFSNCLEMRLQDHIETIAKVSEVAGKEYSIEQALDKMVNEWNIVTFELIPYKSTGTFMVKFAEEISQLLDDHIVMTQSMTFSPYKKAFEERINKWEFMLRTTQDVLDEWNVCQRQWLYLEPIFSSEDINRQLPVESKRYQTMDRMWRKIMKNAKDTPQVIALCPDIRLLDTLRECNKLLEMVQKGLSEYLETKRNAFPRFYFLSDDELLEILSQTKDPTAVQPHLRKCFENIALITFASDLKITEMISAEGEKVPFMQTLYPEGNVEDWLLQVENVMRESLRLILKNALADYKTRPRTQWVLNWPGQLVIAGCQTYWTAEVAEALEQGNLSSYVQVLLSQLDDLRNLVRSPLTRTGRQILSALIVIEVHAREVVVNMEKEKVSSVNDFEWIGQLRYYWVNEYLYLRAVNAEFQYACEYLGNSGRLVITPLTDRCYLTLTGALHLLFGGAPAGPAGTGKTETTKDLAKAMAIQCVVFNCSDQLDFMAMGKFFKGLASSGAWACFDEFNRIDIEVLSVVAQQITTIQKAQAQKLDVFMFEGVELALKRSCSVFITMNPGYAGRTELPDNLKALFRPVAMMVPDYALIAEISLFSFGFSDAKVLSKKIVTTFKLSSEQLSSQDHYDFGMRAVKSVISAAGNLKRQNPTMDEELITLRAIRDVNVPKFLLDDLKLFNGIVSDLFPSIKEEVIDYGALLTALKNACTKMNLKDVDGFVHKCIQLYETTVVRHGLMLVGPTGSGKTKCYEVLQRAQTELKGIESPGGNTFEPTFSYVLNPKSITMGQLYGEFDLMTHEWTDGILPALIRIGASATTEEKRWYMFDGPVDAVWIENMNTVLDDNKKLCLSSGEIIKLTEHMTMMFEVQDLAVASPATVSRCGMVYLEPNILKLQPFIDCWLNELSVHFHLHADKISSLCDALFQSSIVFLRQSLKEIVPTMDSNLTFSFIKLMNCFFKPFRPPSQLPADRFKRIAELVEPWFCFSLIWTVGATCDNDGRVKFDEWMRNTMAEAKIQMLFPSDGLVYDYRLDDAGISVFDPEAENEEANRSRQICWKNWIDGLPDFKIPSDAQFQDIIVPTLDNIRTTFVVELLLTNMKPILCIGPTGTGKTMSIASKLTKSMPHEFTPEFITFSAKTSANQTQDLIDGKLDKRRKGIFGPPLGKYMIIFIDDLNMPLLEVYGAQPPIELLRQWMDFNGWYDRKMIGEFRTLIDVNVVCAMGPPGGGRNPVTPRLMRHFNFLAYTELEDQSKAKIFSTILKWWLDGSANMSQHTERLVETCISVYNTIMTQLLPTPSKSHYTFNLRDLSRVFQGLLMGEASKLATLPDLLRLWYHESLRVFADRLVNVEDNEWFSSLLQEKIKSDFDTDVESVISTEPLLYADFMSPSSGESRPYVELIDHPKMMRVLQEFLEEYNQVNTNQMHLVLFTDAVRHLCRITRVIRQPLGNGLLLGVGGSGRQSLTRLAAHIAEYDLFQVELAKNYGVIEWHEDLKKVMMKAGLDNVPLVFLFSDTQIKSEAFLEDLNNILNSGDVPNIYAQDDMDNILTRMKATFSDPNVPPTKTNLFSAYVKRIRSNLHTVITMSPMGEVFRARLRQFPALVNCCTIDWFNAWPADALRSVAIRFLSDSSEVMDASEEVIDGLVLMCQEIHSSVAKNSIRFLHELGRYNYVTPTSYLELLGIFSRLLSMKQVELSTAKNRTQTGLNKLLSTAEEVSKLQEELEQMQPQLEEAVQESIVTMQQISQDTKVAEETKHVVQKEEAQAAQKALETQAIADDAQRDLNEALPTLDAALASLKSLNKNDVVEVRAMQRPPDGVRLVVEAVCIMKNIKPKKVPGEKPGEKKDDYWEPGKGLLADPQKFLDSLFKFDKDNISEAIIKSIQPYIDNEAFQPAAIAKVSKACTSICQWVRAMHKYHFISKGVAPKREALRIAQEDLAETQRILDGAKKRLRDVEQGVALLQTKYNDCVRKKHDLETNTKLCEARLIRADKLIGGLSDEKGRWFETIQNLEKILSRIMGDVLISAGCVAYMGSFTGDYRARIVKEWIIQLDSIGVPRNDHCLLTDTMSDPVKIRSWQIAGLPKDNLSVENGIIIQYSRRWSLFIDPQGQANKWIKNLEKDNAIDVVKLSDKDFLRSLENAIRFGKPCLMENVGEELDPSLEPVLLKQTFKQQGSLVLKLGDTIIPYHEDFKFYITTKLPNPHYTPETSTKVTLINFTLSPSGLQDQLLGIVVAEERPDLEDAKNQLIVSNAKMKEELKEIEDKILMRLSASEGSPVDDIDLINTLEASKIKSQEIKAKVIIAEQTEKDIDVTRSLYIPVATNSQILFFCVSDLSKIDPMYQYSLEWFTAIFLGSIANAEKTESVHERIKNINDYFRFSLYCNVCRSLFEKHKLLFAVLLAARVMQHQGTIDMDEWRYFLAGGTQKVADLPNPAPDWLSERAWNDILTLSALKNFSSFASDFPEHLSSYKANFDSLEPHREILPEPWDTNLDLFQKVLVLRCLRPDKVTNAMQDFVANVLGQRFIEPQTAELGAVYKDSSPITPLIFVLSTGTDPANGLYKFAEEMKFSKKLSVISLGQGQGPRAEALMRSAMDRGLWVFFQNCHLAPSWMPSLERLIEQIDIDKVHKDFRLWLTSMPSPSFPVFILQNGSKMTVEPPRGLKANLLRSYGDFTDDFLNSCGARDGASDQMKTVNFKHLLLSLCLFHGVIIERRKFGALGFNIPYEFTDGDLRICVSQLKMFLDEYTEAPYKVLRYTCGHINYGGRVTDDWDRRCLMSILGDFYCADVLSSTFSYSKSGIYRQLKPETNHAGYFDYVKGLPINDTPEIFGLHDNANITFAQNETYTMLSSLLLLQPKTAVGGGRSREEIMDETANRILAQVPKPVSLEKVMTKYPVMYEQSMNTVLMQEVIRYNRLLKVIISSLNDVQKANKGLVVMSQQLENVANSLFNNQVPGMWSGKAYPSLKPLASWVADLVARMNFILDWIDNGIPPVFWISGFFFPQAFLTGTLQNYARKKRISIDTISFNFEVKKESLEECSTFSSDGCLIRGLFVEGARWGMDEFRLVESRPKELYTDMPIIWLKPAANRKPPEYGVYDSPVYKTLTRAGTLSTTGHSTNFVFTLEVPSREPQKHWIKRGVALLCALNY